MTSYLDSISFGFTLRLAVTSYLLGSIPFGYLLVRVFRGQDVRQTGSGNIGATNVARTGSRGLAIATLILDALKGFVAVRIAYHLAGAYSSNPLVPPSRYIADYVGGAPEAMYVIYASAAFAGLCALIGHMFPVWLGFKGGKGVATGLGAFLAIAPAAVGVVLLVFVAIVAVTRYVSLGSIVGAAAFPVAAWWLNAATRSPAVLVLMAASSLLIILRHKDNIRRLLAGNENRFGGKKTGVA